MPFKPGQSGNPKGRPPASLTLSDEIRRQLAAGDNAGLQKLVGTQIEIATGVHRDALSRQKAAEWLARHGWPGAQKASVEINDEDRTITVTWQTAATEQAD